MTIALDVLFVSYNTEEIRLAYKAKYSFKCRNQVVLLLVTNGKKWHYLAVKNCICKNLHYSGVTSKHDGDFYCLNCFHSLSTEKKIKKHKKYLMIMITIL